MPTDTPPGCPWYSGRRLRDPDPALTALVDGVDLLCLDAGNTIVFLDHARLARECARAGFLTSEAALVRCEGEAKIAIERAEPNDAGWAVEGVSGSRSWGLVVGTMLFRAGLPAHRVPVLLDTLWSSHRARNFWSLLPDGLADAIARVRAAGVRVAVVSNAEGTLASIFEDLGILGVFDLVIDSGIVGVEKPDPRIFRIALERFAVPPERALHLGDTYTSDIVGARAAGLRFALIDPHGHYAGCHPHVPRVPGAPEVAHALARARS
jgi:HAD superfamily hydrolase (TIGR01509 family)